MPPHKASVSVIVPTYNRPTKLKSALNSITNQTFSDFEILVIDDASRVQALTRNRLDQYDSPSLA
ncbi:glycosyltransferase [Halostagnicola sp. A56]|uniref:glycosyltransferase family 2 protein n=1 Tax=Halostagnicola sp. A56 TaxID=1495067 RepID=UPI0009E1F147